MRPEDDSVALRETTCADGTVIRHLEAGRGPALVLLPGWSQTANIFRHQLSGLSDSYRVIAVDHRGHGNSARPEIGYHIHRLAADVRAVINQHCPDRVHLLGHSMGCAVIWSYLELFGDDTVGSLVLVDQMPCALRNPAWSDGQAEQAGATMDARWLFEFTDRLRADDGTEDPRCGFVGDLVSEGVTPQLRAWLVEQSQTFDRRHAARLLFDVATHDWRDFVKHISRPTLVVAGDSANVPIASQRWLAAQLPQARMERIRGLRGGTHLPFLENPDAFNAAVRRFLHT